MYVDNDYVLFCMIILRSPITTRTCTLFPYPTLFRLHDRPDRGAARGAAAAPLDARAGADRRGRGLSARASSGAAAASSEEHTSELQSLMRISYTVFCLKQNKTNKPSISPKDQHHTTATITQKTETKAT